MPPDIEKEHALETYKSLMQYGSGALRFVLLVNGGAAVALLTFVGNVIGKGGILPDIRWIMGLFLLGVLLGGFATATSYITQFVLYNEATEQRLPKALGGHMVWLCLSLIFILGGIVSFGAGALLTVLELGAASAAK